MEIAKNTLWRDTCARSQPLSKVLAAILHSKMADEGEKRVKNRLEYKVRRFALSLNVEGNLEATRNSVIGVERLRDLNGKGDSADRRFPIDRSPAYYNNNNNNNNNKNNNNKNKTKNKTKNNDNDNGNGVCIAPVIQTSVNFSIFNLHILS